MTPPNHDQTIGLIMWAIIIGLYLMMRWVSRNTKGATPSTPAPAEQTTGTGPKWEQDEPYALMLGEDDFDPIFPEEES